MKIIGLEDIVLSSYKLIVKKYNYRVESENNCIVEKKTDCIYEIVKVGDGCVYDTSIEPIMEGDISTPKSMKVGDVVTCHMSSGIISFCDCYYIINSYDIWGKIKTTNMKKFSEKEKVMKIENMGLYGKTKMKRFMGSMPSSEIETTKTYKDPVGMKIRIDAGKRGWTIIYADSSTEFDDVEDTTENNLQAALVVLKTHLEVVEYVEE